jgi:hypothetical protein
MRHTVLTVGLGNSSQRTRDLLLESDGLETTHAGSEEAPSILGKSKFDLIVLAHDVSEEGRQRILAVADKTTTLIQLERFTYPAELIELVRQVLNGGKMPGKVVRIDHHKQP